MTNNLLRTDGGSELSPELVLLIVEFIEYSPDQMNTLVTLCKSFRGLLLNHQYSITNRIYKTQIRLQTKRTQRMISCCEICVALADNLRAEVAEIASRKGPIILSAISQGLARRELMPNTYSWLSEQSFRKHVNTTLVKSSFMKNFTSNHHVQGGLPLESFPALTFSIQLRTLDLLYAFAECTVSGEPNSRAQDLAKHSSTCNPYELRKAQESYLLRLSPQLLALLGVSAVIISAQYVVSEAISRPGEILSIHDERLVFEERLLRHGPFFLWGYVAGSPVVKNWVRSEMNQGMQEMRDFESGKANCFPSLQSMLSRIFCEKVQCVNFPGRWSWMATEVDRLVELGCL